MGTVARSLMNFVGLGSVSDYCAHHMPCPVVVIKDDVPRRQMSTFMPITEQLEEGEEGVEGVE